MDGGKVASRVDVGLRRTLAFALVSLALVPLALLVGGEGAKAEGPPPSVRYAAGSPGMLAAQALARQQWGTDPCGGQVDIVWSGDDATINARSYWANPKSAYDDPQLNTQCRIVFNAQIDFDWVKFCTVVVHEYGHLAGHPHSADGPDVMSPIYRAPLPACVATPDPSASAQPPAAESATDQPATARQALSTRTTKKSKLRADRSRQRARPRARAASALPQPLRHWDSGHDHLH